MLAVRRGGVDSVRQLVARMFLMETQVADVVGMVIMMMVVLVMLMTMSEDSFEARTMSCISL